MFNFNLSQRSLSPAVAPAALLAASVCLAAGEVSANTSQRIIGGQPIVIDATPSIVAMISVPALQNTGSVAMSQFCGGTLIDPSWVLTAAHCVVVADEISSPDEIQIVANSHDLNNITADPINVAQIIVHENYSDDTNANDIALIQLSSPAVSASQVAPLNTTAVSLDEELIAAGWGARQFNIDQGSFDFADNLQAVGVLGLPAEICNTLPAYAGNVSDTMLCAGFPEGGFDSCQGDSGGPLYRRGPDGSLIVAGITSWGDGCALANRPGVYTDVASFNDWIRSNSTIGGTSVEPVFEPELEPELEPEPPVAEVSPGLSVTSNPEDGSTVVVLPSVESLQAAAGSVSGWLSLILLGFIGARGRRAAR